VETACSPLGHRGPRGGRRRRVPGAAYRHRRVHPKLPHHCRVVPGNSKRVGGGPLLHVMTPLSGMEDQADVVDPTIAECGRGCAWQGGDERSGSSMCSQRPTCCPTGELPARFGSAFPHSVLAPLFRTPTPQSALAGCDGLRAALRSSEGAAPLPRCGLPLVWQAARGAAWDREVTASNQSTGSDRDRPACGQPPGRLRREGGRRKFSDDSPAARRHYFVPLLSTALGEDGGRIRK